MATVDVLIAGGGVMGSAIAYFLAADPDFTGNVQVVEPDPSYQFASSPRSLGGVRQQFSNLENIQIGLFGHHFVTHVDHYLTVDGEAPALSFREGGYLFLAS
ncbi:MAG: FAD-dependent oxidoreductase, partial [Pseudomonadota bacterium]|nr:FAD-dependent oxidoreductase [Pseudomonadota bacterium]